MTEDEPERILRPLPGWSQLPSQQTDPSLPPVPAPEPGTSPPPSPETARLPGPASPPPGGPGPTPSGRSPRTGADARELGKVIAGLLRIVAGFAARFIAGRGGVLRRPDAGELDGMAQPVARILVRHAPDLAVSEDVTDIALAGSAVGNYFLADEPLITQAAGEYRQPDEGNPS